MLEFFTGKASQALDVQWTTVHHRANVHVVHGVSEPSFDSRAARMPYRRPMRRVLRLTGVGAIGAVAIGAVVWLTGMLVAWFTSLSPEMSAVIAGITGVLLVPLITFFTSRALEQRRSRDDAIREKKTAIYDKLIRDLMKMLNLSKSKDPLTADFITEVFADTTPSLITYGSRSVIRAWNRFRSESAKGSKDPAVLLFAFEDVLIAIRQDLGHATFGQKRGDLLRVFVTDVDTLFRN